MTRVTVNCRIGSLEIYIQGKGRTEKVNCRIGSLEIGKLRHHRLRVVNCRIGSLEKNGMGSLSEAFR